jgi:tripartite-type tricarboxylate transporter receptor subunit TctC
MIKTVALLAAFGASLAGAAHAGEYPEKPIRFILPNAPGGSPDTIARLLAVRLTDILGQPFIIDNRPGAGGIIAVEAVAKATPDGYTLLQCGISQTISPALKRKLPYDTWNDLARIVQYGGVPNVLMVYTGLPARTLAELVDHARANPGRLKYGSSGIGFTPHLTMEMFRRAAGIELLHVPYKAAPQAVSDVIGGQIDLMFSNVPGALPNIRAGRVRGVAVTTLRRSEQAPDIPTIAESGYPGFEMTSWYGSCAPARTPKPVLARLESALLKALAEPDIRKRFFEQGVELRTTAGAQFDAFYKSEVARWSKVVLEAGIKPE